MEKFDDSSGDEENYFNELRNFELKVLPGLHLRRFAKREVESACWTKALGTRIRTKTTTNWCTSPSRLTMHSRNFRKNFFSDLATIKFNTNFHCKCFSGVESHLNAFGEQNLNTNDWVLYQVLQTNSFCSKNFKDNRVSLRFNKVILSNSSSFWWIISLKSASLVLRDRL